MTTRQMIDAATLIPITDSIGKPVLHNAEVEPEPSSVVLTEGEFGTAWQRYFSDGLWHRVGGKQVRTWEALCKTRNLVLVYEAEVRR
jgi:hypothetical protein